MPPVDHTKDGAASGSGVANPVLIVPGLGGSGPSHWQSHMAHLLAADRVEQADWDAPDPKGWLDQLSVSIQRLAAKNPGQKILLAAHSLGCVLTVRWILDHPKQAANLLQGALLVAPADVDSPAHTPDEVRRFAPIPTAPLVVPSLLVASASDPYCSLDQAEALAAAWGAAFCNLGDAGHINVASGFGPWPLGLALLRRLASGG